VKRKLAGNAFLKSKLFWAIVAEFLILLVGFILRPDFLSIQLRTLADGTRVLYGTPIDIFNRSAEITLIAMGMTLVIALGGTDISVGALVAVAGAIALKFLRWDVLIYNTPGDYTVKPYFYAIAVPLIVCALMGLFNGSLIAKLKIQPIIATLILMVGGRGIAQIITNGKQFTTQYSPFKFIGNGSILGIPFPIIITLVVVVAVMVFVRKTSFGMFVESVGINPSASRLSGLKSGTIIMIVYTLTGFLSGISGLIYSSRISSNDSNNAGLGYEMDAILAVVIGGTSMTGGKFSLFGTVVGSLIIRTITTLVMYFGVVSEAIMAFKALIIAVVIVLQSEPVRNAIAKRRERRHLNIGGEMHA
jgi:simple sugar transport system permease protein